MNYNKVFKKFKQRKALGANENMKPRVIIAPLLSEHAASFN